VDEDQVVLPGEGDRILECAVRDDRSGRVVRVVEVEKVRASRGLLGNCAQIREEGILFRQRQVVHLCAREDRAGGVRRIAGFGTQAHVAGVEGCHRDVPDRLLAAEHGNHLRGRIELDAEALAVEARGGLAKLDAALIRWVLMRGGIAERRGGRLDDRIGRRHVRVADP
jgi:hypothetical protein